ncbi:hypothetical protein G7Y89_g3348 [Cudoniella acicularis]|uniref:Uncharacterized protein n=1 Tax=Cudoniella acicularis TaxID=354080 RepID=A0A8H4RRK0_9HELO|nr:hypothetical protein G7Y89_g3348 [Cudoniella acicularis]
MAQTSQQGTLSWEKIDSKEGVTFEVGRTEYELAAKAKVEEAANNDKEFFGLFEGKKSFDIQVRWVVGVDKLIPTTQDVLDKTAISAYNLTTNGNRNIGFEYYLEFNNTKNYNFYFYDESGDSYQVDCFITGNHSVKFNSPKPTIVRITGS